MILKQDVVLLISLFMTVFISAKLPVVQHLGSSLERLRQLGSALLTDLMIQCFQHAGCVNTFKARPDATGLGLLLRLRFANLT